MRLVVDARTSAFAALVDYAGVFPPASLDVARAVIGYRAARNSDASWVAGRFLIRASQLETLASIVTTSMRAGEDPWELGVVFDGQPAVSAAQAAAFHAEMDPAVVVAAAEAQIDDPSFGGISELFTTIGSINPTVVEFLEVTRTADTPKQISMIASIVAETGRVGGAKLRCGGITADLFPTPDEVALFVVAAVEARLPFKATAGLHQPVRHFDDSLGVHRHGFLNILMATTAAAQGEPIDTVTDIVSETDPDAFNVSAAFATWRDLRFPGSVLRRVRQSRFVAYGSCDFDEPVDGLRSLGLLGEGT